MKLTPLDHPNSYQNLWKEPAIESRIVEGIERHWKSDAVVQAPGEDKVYSGLLFGDLTPKPSYYALQQLLQEEWRTHTEGVTDADGCYRFRGFHGNYEVEAGSRVPLILEPGKTSSVTVSL